MPLSSVAITGDIADQVGSDFDARRTKVWVTTNVPDSTVIDTDGNKIRLGSGSVTLNADGTFSASVWVPGTGSNPASWQTYFHVDYPDAATRIRRTRTFGPFTVTAAADLADLVEQQEVPPTYLTTVTAQLDTYVTEAEAARDAAVDISNIAVPDDVVSTLIEGTGGAGPLTRSALSASYARAGYVVQSAASADGTDQAAVINAELADMPTGSTLVLPPGSIYVSTALSVPSYATIAGAGRGTALYWTGTGALVTLASKVQVKFRNLRVHLTAADQIAFDVSNSFRCTWSGCIIEGEHVSTATTYRGQIGFNLRDNAGDNRIMDCDLNNLGTAFKTDSVSTWVVGCIIGTCWRGIVSGDPAGVNFLGALSVNSCTFVGSPTAGVTDTHVLIDGSAAEFWFSHVWFEKGDNAVIVGNGQGGPRSFGMRDARISARLKCLELNRGPAPQLEDITFGDESGTATPVQLFIDPTGCPTGKASGLRAAGTFDFADADFPPDWFIYRRGVMRLPSSVSGNLALTGGVTAAPTATTTVGLKAKLPSDTTANLLELGRGSAVSVSVDRFGVLTAGAVAVPYVDLTNSALPAASASERGRIRFVEGASGVADGAWVCMKDAANAYSWVSLT